MDENTNPENASGVVNQPVSDPQPDQASQSNQTGQADQSSRHHQPEQGDQPSQPASAGTWTPPGMTTPPPPRVGFFDSMRASGWFRSPDHVAGGVCGGLAQKWRVDPIVIRGIAIVLIFFFGVGALLYGLLWMFLPESGTGEILVEQAKNGNAKPILALPIIIAIIGLIRVPSELSITLVSASSAGLLDDGFPGWRFTDMYQGSPFERLATIPAGALFIGAIAWVSFLIYRHEYNKAGAWFLGIGGIGLAAGFAEMFLYGITDSPWQFPVFSMFMMDLFGGFPLAAIVFLIVWLVSRHKTSKVVTPGSFPSGAYPSGTYPAAPASASYPANTVVSTVAAGNNPVDSSSPADFFGSGTNPPEGFAPLTAQSPSTTQPPATPLSPLAPQIPLAPPKPHLAGPSLPFNLAVGGLILLANVAGMSAQFSGLHAASAFLLTLGLITVILGGAMLVLAARRHRTSWLAWVTPLFVVLLTIPATGVAVAIPKLNDLNPGFWQDMLSSQYYNLEPGSDLNAVNGQVEIDLRDQKNLSEPITVNNFGGQTRIFLHPDQPVRLELNLTGVEFKLSSMSEWSGDEVRSSGGAGVLRNGKIDSDRPQYFNAAGEKVTFTDSTLNTGFGDGGSVMKQGQNSVASVVIENAAAKGAKEATEAKEGKKSDSKGTAVIELNQVYGGVTVYERPREEVWNGTILPDGHYLVTYWLDKNSNTQVPDSSAIPPAIKMRMVESDAILGGKMAYEYESATQSASLTDIKAGRLGPWADANNNGYNDHYEPGGDKWREGDTVSFEPVGNVQSGTVPSDEPSVAVTPPQNGAQQGGDGKPGSQPEGTPGSQSQAPKPSSTPAPEGSPTDIPDWLNSFPKDSLSDVPPELRQRIQELRRQLQDQSA
ncbi:MAG: PspC domain-containing protein [Mobiluncus porci]|uniref:PspC domain-containing protein n=1 Tax=Mobiluncus porci TaxID=2652278 RepID=UPI0023F32900|nr:PspC domain-containing protein [Mobiluncus porci]MDD7540721.1 PspC domain-containing protein [Mobiluncus porci]MDY5748283.1 PspC domain-containing protein [Mobiluncus porci]